MSTIKVRRGTENELDAITLDAGEFGYTTDKKILHLGDGTNNNIVSVNSIGPADGAGYDPDTTLYPYMISNHANTPGTIGSCSYWHIRTYFYNVLANTANRAQQAISYHPSGADVHVLYRHYYSGSWTNWVAVWTQDNDGTGSGLDADKLDGVEGAVYDAGTGITNNSYVDTDVLNSSAIPIGFSRIYKDSTGGLGLSWVHILTVKHSTTRGYQIVTGNDNKMYFRSAASNGNSWQTILQLADQTWVGSNYAALNGSLDENFNINALSVDNGITVTGGNININPTTGGSLIVGTSAGSGVDSTITISGARIGSATSNIASVLFKNDTAVSYDMARIAARDPAGDDNQGDGELVFNTSNNGSLNLALTLDENQNAEFSGSVKLLNTGDYFQAYAESSYDKFRLWNSSNYSIGMAASQTWAYLDGYAVTFTMPTTTDNGWLWRNTGNSSAEGVMALTNTGSLSVKEKVSIGPTGTECTIEFNATEESIDFIIA